MHNNGIHGFSNSKKNVGFKTFCYRLGVDDAYLMINSWNVNSARRRGMRSKEQLRERIAEVCVFHK